MLDANLRAKTFWRMGVLLPYVVAPVAVGLVFSKMFADGSGMINTLLGYVGIDPVGWHKDAFASHIAIASMVNFRWTGYNALILLAAMQAIPRDLYEAATIDGATRLRQFFSITVPMVRPTMIFVILTSTIGGLQIFDEPRMYDATGLGGSNGQWKTVTLYLYELGWNKQQLGRAAAVAWLLFLIIIVFALLNNWLTRKISSADDLSRSAKAARKQSRKNARALERSLKRTSDAAVPAAAPTEVNPR
jgi:cellobiose transport system permease protein